MGIISIHYYKSPFGMLILGSLDDKLCLCDWQYRKMRKQIDTRIQKYLNADYDEQETPVIRMALEQLQEYSGGHRHSFDIPLLLAGSDFQISVWNMLMTVEYGETESYLGLARRMNNEKAVRAVAAANGANAISIIIPCHRIIGSNGDLTGYAGGVGVKKKLLQLENSLPFSTQLEMFS